MPNTHTPAPWIYEESTKTIRARPSNYWLATMDSWDSAVNHKANAQLIAASPDLLTAAQTALQLIIDTWPYEHGQEAVGLAWQALDEAITKAGGTIPTETIAS